MFSVYIALSSLENSLPWYQVCKQQVLFQIGFLRVSGCCDNDGEAPLVVF